jgi:copper chaperone CopZ
MASQVFKISDMHCTACVMRREGLEDDRPGIRKARASYRSQQLEVDYDEKRLNSAQIVAEIRRLGYTVAGMP